MGEIFHGELKEEHTKRLEKKRVQIHRTKKECPEGVSPEEDFPTILPDDEHPVKKKPVDKIRLRFPKKGVRSGLISKEDQEQ